MKLKYSFACFTLLLFGNLRAWSIGDCWRSIQHTPDASDASIISGVPVVTYHVTAGNRPALCNTHSSRIRQQSVTPMDVNKYSDNTSDSMGLTMAHIQAQMYVESRGDYRAISHKHCHGPMQVNPATGKEHGYPEWSLTHPVIGMDAGITIMSLLWSRWHFVTSLKARWSLTLSSYNAGFPRTIRAYRRFGKHWQRGIPGETRVYLKKVMNRYKEER